MARSWNAIVHLVKRLRYAPIRSSSLPKILFKKGVRSARNTARRFMTRSDFDTALSAAGRDFLTWHRSLDSGAIRLVGLAAPALQALQDALPEQVVGTVQAADRVLEHEFDLLGSGPFVPADPDRPAGEDYVPIDWYLDPVSGLRFPRGIPKADWDLYAMRPGMADIKLPWELARCQHWTVLGQAYRLTGRPRYACEIIRQLDDFNQANPVGVGINWTCTMDVALRALSWAIGLAMIRDCDEISPRSWHRAYASLFEHGQFIYDNLENTYEVTSNHFLSDVVGLHYVAMTFRDLDQGREWLDFCRSSLEREIYVQVLEDGADFESSIPYHRLVTELFLTSARLTALHGSPLSEAYHARLRSMVEYMLAVLRPDGLMPVVGDADDGRAHILTDYGTWNAQDARHLFGPAALYFEQPEWLSYCGAVGLWEAAWWGFEISDVEPTQQGLPSSSRLFPKAGIAVVRDGGNYLLVSNGIVGTQGFGNHKHNDQLSFEYHAGGVPIIVDPGSYVYTSDADARNRFRSTSYHNTVQIDGEEQNKMNPEWLFRLFETAEAEHVDFAGNSEVAHYHGKHVGYARLQTPVVHERFFKFVHHNKALYVLDALQGAGVHELSWHFHFDPSVGVTIGGGSTVEIRAPGCHLAMIVPSQLAVSLSETAYSPSYGVSLATVALRLGAQADLPGESSWLFAIVPWLKRAEFASEDYLKIIAAEMTSKMDLV